MSRPLAGWRSALRMARREARRAKGRSALVVALIGVPVMALAFTAASYDMFTLTAEESLDRQLGAADAALQWHYDGPTTQTDVTGGGWSESPARETVATKSEIEALLPAGSRAIAQWQSQAWTPTASGVGWVEWQAIDLTDPIVTGMISVREGRAPRDATELALTRPAVQRLGIGIGDQLTLPQRGGAADREYTVVGVVEYPGVESTSSWSQPDLSHEVMLFHPDGRPSEDWHRWLVDTPGDVDLATVRELNRHGVLAYSRALAHDPPAELPPPDRGDNGTAFGVAGLIAGLAVLEIVLLAGPAFAVGARRRQRELALLGASGASPAQLRRVVLADGVVLGLVGAVVGLLLGVTAAVAGRPLVEELVMGARAGGYRVFPLALAGIAGLAVLTGTLAALVPAVSAARRDVVDALAGRRGVTRSLRRWLVLGVGLVTLGTAVTAYGAWRVSATTVLAGLVLGQLGLVLCTPSLVGLLARFGSGLPLAPRIALRDTARNRSAAAPAISAVMAAVAGAVAAGVVLVGLNNQEYPDAGASMLPGTVTVTHDTYTEDGTEPAPMDADAIERVARELLPVAGVYDQWTLPCEGADGEEVTCLTPVVVVPPEKQCPMWQAMHQRELTTEEQRAARQDPRCTRTSPQPYAFASIDDGTALPTITGGDPADLAAAAEVLRAGGAVVTDDRYLADGQLTVIGAEGIGGDQVEPPGKRITVPAYHLTSGINYYGALLSPGALSQLGVTAEPAPMLLAMERMPTTAELDAFHLAMVDYPVMTWTEGGPEPRPVSSMLLLLTAAAALVALGAAAIATGLAAADRRPDLATLGAVGASPRVRRVLSLSQSGVIAGLGTALGMVAGLGAAVAVLVALNQRYESVWPGPERIPIEVPWPTMAALLAVPAVAMLGAGLLTRSRLPIERRAV